MGKRVFISALVDPYGVIRYVLKRIRYEKINALYDRNISIQENLATTCAGIPLTTLYRFCKENGIDTAPNKNHSQPSEREKREAKRQEKAKKIRVFQQNYQPDKSIGFNKGKLAAMGLDLSVGTIHSWLKKYPPNSTTKVDNTPGSIFVDGPIPPEYYRPEFENDPMLKELRYDRWMQSHPPVQ